MRDRDIRAALRMELGAEHAGCADTLIIEELGVCEGDARIDLAVINGALNGIEIKSGRDTLERLPAQQEIYSRVFDTVLIVAAPSHLDQVSKQVPAWWGISTAHSMGDRVVLSRVREPRENPTVDPHSLVKLLWRDEALAILEQLGEADGMRSKPRKVLWERLANVLALDDLRACVRRTLKARTKWRGRA